MELSFLLTFFSSSFFFFFVYFYFFCSKRRAGTEQSDLRRDGAGIRRLFVSIPEAGDSRRGQEAKLQTEPHSPPPPCSPPLSPPARRRASSAGNGTHWTPREDGGAALPPTTPLALLAAPMRLGLAWLSPAAGVTVVQCTTSHTLALTEGGDVGPETLLQGHPVLLWMAKGRLA